MKPRPIPADIVAVEVPYFFAPSQWVAMERCAVGVWGRSQVLPQLLATPDMLFGTLLHKVRERLLCEGIPFCSRLAELERLLPEETALLERQLIDEGRGECVPLRNVIGWRKWTDRILRLESWASGLDPLSLKAAAGTHKKKPGGLASSRVNIDMFAEGAEPRWQAVCLRLAGCPDEARISADGEVQITDLKTGRVFTPEGDFQPGIVAQLGLYALMAEHLVLGKKVRLFVQHSRRDDLHWGDEPRVAMKQRLAEQAERYPPGLELDVAQVACPGSHCSGCALRPCCSAYKKLAPAWWMNEPNHPRPLPYDVWGTISFLDVADTVRLEIVDPAGRLVQVEGLSLKHGWDEMAVGSRVYLFNLEATEDTLRHGARIHPRNFHEVAPGRAWPDALSVSVFS